MAVRASVTVSIAAESSGMFRRMVAGQPRREIGVAREHGALAGQQQNVVEGECEAERHGQHGGAL